MCGILGHIDPGLSPDQSRELVKNQLKTIEHRGPDGKGFDINAKYSFGHARLAIIDLETGAQPMTGTFKGKKLTIAFNGEIYNYIELKAELEKAGHHFRTTSDTEVILAGFAEWGSEVFNKLNGMFAIALFDHSSEALVCARDSYGQKPFFYWHSGDRFYFGSEARVFKDIPGFGAQLDLDSMAEFLAFEALYYDRTIYKGLKKLPPGHCLIFRNGQLEVKEFFRSVPVNRYSNMEECETRIHALMKDAVRISYRADVPVGLLLSGGLDSTMVLALLRDVYPDKKITTFTIQNEDKTYDESHYAKEAADLFNSEHKNFPINLDIVKKLAMEVPELLDEPLADPGILPRYFVTKELRKHHKVALTGDGGDEFFYGYLVFKAQQLSKVYNRVPTWVHSGLVKPLVGLIPNQSGYMRKDFLVKQFMKGYPASEAHRNYRWTSSYMPEDLQKLLRTGAKPDFGLRYLEQLDEDTRKSGHMAKFAYKYQHTYLPDHVLINSDRTSMLNSVELRCPFLDTRLTRELNLIDDKIKMPGFTTKHFMKKIAKKYLPDSLIERKKVGFTVPIADLLKKDLRSEVARVFHPDLLKRQGFFDPAYVANMVERHNSGRENLYKPLWTLFALQKWLLKNNFS
jgi:asparagine synthase (glutamine-hydrolysing)